MTINWRDTAVVFGAALALALLLVPTAGAYDRDVLRDAGPDELVEYMGKDGCAVQVLRVYQLRRDYEQVTEEIGLSGEEARQSLYGRTSADPDAAEDGVPHDLIGVHIVDGLMEGKSMDELHSEVVDLCNEHLDPPEAYANY